MLDCSYFDLSLMPKKSVSPTTIIEILNKTYSAMLNCKEKMMEPFIIFRN